jgi:glycosyltransferase involved in cell wall biosynthesis
LQVLAGDAAIRRRLGQKNRERCVAEYSLGKMVREYEQEYRAAAAQRSQK